MCTYEGIYDVLRSHHPNIPHKVPNMLQFLRWSACLFQNTQIAWRSLHVIRKKKHPKHENKPKKLNIEQHFWHFFWYVWGGETGQTASGVHPGVVAYSTSSPEKNLPDIINLQKGTKQNITGKKCRVKRVRSIINLMND